MPHLIARRLREEGGFTMVIVLGVLMVVMGVTLAMLETADGDNIQNRRNQASKASYAAADAGLQTYLSRLNQDPTYWTQCDAPDGVTQPGDSPDWQPIAPGSTSQYTIEMLPNSGPTCDTANPEATMTDADGAFRIRVTGEAASGGAAPAHRSIVATFKRSGFLDYLLWTDKEDTQPGVFARVWSCDYRRITIGTSACYATAGDSTGAGQTLQQWATAECGAKYWRPPGGRSSATAFPGVIKAPPVGSSSPLTWQDYETWFRANATYPSAPLAASRFPGLFCEELSFGTSDVVNGPLHTNDGLRICGAPAFGRTGQADPIETEARQGIVPDEEPWRPDTSIKLSDGSANCPGVNQPNFTNRGVWTPGAGHMDMPPDNAELQSQANFTFTGGTKILFNGTANTMTVTNANQSPTTKTFTLPASAVIWIANNGASNCYDPMFPAVPAGAFGENCGDLSVSGTYNTNITIGSADDIVITDDLKRATAGGPAMLGLVANNFVRIAHPTTWGTPACGTTTCPPLAPWAQCKNTIATPLTQDLNLEAAILAVNGSFLLDHWGCGEPLGTLTFTGAIAQRHRGNVGSSGGTGFTKNYAYDTRLRARTPPHFLNPVNAAWHIAREVEQAPPAY